jgi:hypothetical protein
LRDVKNHEDAFKASGAWIPLEPSDYSDIVPFIMGRKSLSSPSGEVFDLPRLKELFQLMRSLTALRSGDDLVARIKRREHKDLCSELTLLLHADDIPLPGRLREQIESGAGDVLDLSWPRALMPHSTLEWTTTVGSLLVAIASASLASPVATLLSFGFWAVSTGGPGAAQKFSLVSTPYHGPRLPFMLMFGTTKPTLRQLQDMLARLEKLY